MDHSAPLPAPARHARRVVPVGLAILGVAVIAFVARQPPVAPAPPGTSTGRQPAVASAPPRPSAVVHPSSIGHSPSDEDDGAIPDGVVVSAFDEEVAAVGNLDPDLLAALRRAAIDAGADGVALGISSGWRSPGHQRRLLQDAVAEHGSLDEAARWVATAETSAHVSGEAVDIGPLDAAAWLSEHGAAHGLCQIYRNEPWHFELRPDAVGDGCPPMYEDPTEDPRMQP